jgi:hypothetical protein
VADPSALVFLLLVPVIVLIYMVRSRYRRRQVSSVMLWRSVRRDLEARQKLRLPPLSLLMLLQVLAVLAGVFALVKPALPAQDRTHLVVVVDSSASMSATDVAPSRFEAARDLARYAIGQLEPGDQVSLIQAGASPSLLATGPDAAAALGALDQLRPGSVSADVASALRVGEALIQKTGGQGGILLLSDGTFGPSFEAPEIGVPVSFSPIGVAGDNQGITALDVRLDLDGSGRWSAFARVTNYSDVPVQLPAVATADGLVLERRELSLPARSSTDLTFGLPAGIKAFALAIEPDRVFAGDDRAEVRVEELRQRKVLVVSADPGPVEKLLHTLPGLQVSTVSPDHYGDTGGADLVVLDQFVPQVLPAADLLIMNPPMDAPGFVTSPVRTDASVLRSTEGSPLLDSVDLHSLRLGQAVRLETPEWAYPVVEGPAGPLVLQGEQGGRRVVILDFDWLLTDLPRMQAFPLLLSNIVGELDPLALPSSISPGTAVALRPMADALEATVKKPDGTTSRVSMAEGAHGFDDTEQVGQYTVTWKGPALGEVSSGFNVNLNSAVASDIAPVEHSFGTGDLYRAASPVGPGLQLWPFAAMGLLALLLIEWTYFTRRA